MGDEKGNGKDLGPEELTEQDPLASNRIVFLKAHTENQERTTWETSKMLTRPFYFFTDLKIEREKLASGKSERRIEKHYPEKQ